MMVSWDLVGCANISTKVRRNTIYGRTIHETSPPRPSRLEVEVIASDLDLNLTAEQQWTCTTVQRRSAQVIEHTERDYVNGSTMQWVLGIGGALGLALGTTMLALAPSSSNEANINDEGDETFSDRERNYVLGTLLAAGGAGTMGLAIANGVR
ncbi:MAG: hypothetical protein QF464_14785, partial [Myxococcota bacterium]|nr:hypothetical protein [Myxococcota bacterium]